MGLQSSRVNKEYYDSLFGYRFGRPLEEITPMDYNKLIYQPYQPLASQQLLQSPLVMQNNGPYPLGDKITTETGMKGKKHPKDGVTYFYYEKPDIVYYSVPVNQTVPIVPMPSKNRPNLKSRANTYFRSTKIVPSIQPVQ